MSNNYRKTGSARGGKRGAYRGVQGYTPLGSNGRPWVTSRSKWEFKAENGADENEPPWMNQRGELLAKISYISLLDEADEPGDGDEGNLDAEGGAGKATKFVDVDSRDVEFVASYTWIRKADGEDASTVPTILVPGAPPLWKGPKKVVKVPDDLGEYLRDINKTRSPLYPLEPAIRALLTLKPNYPTASVDLFVCASTLSKLMSFCDELTAPTNGTFRMDIEKIGNTVFFRRNEGPPGQLIPDIIGYGHNFAEMHTQWDPTGQARLQGGGESHQRIVAYTFAGLRLLVRFETDGYLSDKVDTATISKDAERRKSIHLNNDSTDLLNLFGQLDISSSDSPATAQPPPAASSKSPAKPPSQPTKSNSPPPQIPPESTELSLYSTPNLHIHRSFFPIPQSAIYDLKTRSMRRYPIDMATVLFRLWINRTPNFIVAYHKNGLFDPEYVEVMDVRDEVDKWAAEHKPALERLGRLLDMLVETCRASSGERWEVSRVMGGDLEIRRPWVGEDGVEGEEEGGTGGRSVLPEVLRRRWVEEVY